MEYPNAHYVRHIFTGLYFIPNNFGHLVSSKGKLYKTNNDIIAQTGRYENNYSCHDTDGSIRRKLDESGITPTQTNTSLIWDLPTGERAIQYLDGKWDYNLRQYINPTPSKSFTFISRGEHFERVPVRLSITIDLEDVHTNI